MEQTREAITTTLAERLCWQVAQRDDMRVARRLYRKQIVDGVSPLEAGAVPDEFFPFLAELEVRTLLQQARGKGVERELGPMVQSILLYGLKTLFGIASMKAWPELLFRDAASMRLVGFKAHQVRHGVCPRGAAKRQGPRTAGPICPEALANNLVKLDWRALEALCNGALRALSKAGLLRAKVTGSGDGTDLETTAQDEGCGQVTRKRKRTDKHGQVRAIEVTAYGWKVSVLIDAATKIPRAVKVVPIHEPEGLYLRALVTQARTNPEGDARLSKVVGDRGFPAGPDLWWLDQHGLTFVVPAKEDMAVTADARALAAASDGITGWGAGPTPSAMGRAERPGVSGWRPRWEAWPG